MQTDDDVGKIAATAPVVMAKAVECFIEDILEQSKQVSILKNGGEIATNTNNSGKSSNNKHTSSTSSTCINAEHLKTVLTARYRDLFPRVIMNLDSQLSSKNSQKQSCVQNKLKLVEKSDQKVKIKKRKKVSLKSYEDSD